MSAGGFCFPRRKFIKNRNGIGGNHRDSGAAQYRHIDHIISGVECFVGVQTVFCQKFFKGGNFALTAEDHIRDQHFFGKLGVVRVIPSGDQRGFQSGACGKFQPVVVLNIEKLSGCSIGIVTVGTVSESSINIKGGLQ